MLNIMFGGPGLIASRWPIIVHHLVSNPAIHGSISLTGQLGSNIEQVLIHIDPVHFAIGTAYKTIQGNVLTHYYFFHRIVFRLQKWGNPDRLTGGLPLNSAGSLGHSHLYSIFGYH